MTSTGKMPQNMGTISSLWCRWHNFIHAPCFHPWNAYTMGWLVVATCATCGFLVQAYWSPLNNARPISSFTLWFYLLYQEQFWLIQVGVRIYVHDQIYYHMDQPKLIDTQLLLIYLLCMHDMFRIDWACLCLNFSMSSL